jgi:hypothetical protein
MQMARPQCDTPLVYNHYLLKISELKNQVLKSRFKILIHYLTVCCQIQWGSRVLLCVIFLVCYAVES